MNESNHSPARPCRAPTPEEITRRSFFARLSVTLGGLCAAVLAVPLVGFVVAPLFRRPPDTWIPVGDADDFEIGRTVNVPFPDPSPLPWAGISAKSAAWLRRDSKEEFTAFSIHCTHMGCPVRWLPDAELFMCPCHGGVYYKDGAVAAGPPPKPLVRYDVRVASGRVEIKAAGIPITTKL
jgi:menaquinol-cytochrome c reductase iron-sulfur subunit